jgi:hypothetical protein
MISRKEFEELKPSLGFRCESIDIHQVNNQRCLKCGSRQIFAGWLNPKTGRGYAKCCDPHCDTVEELGVDR